MVSCIVSWRALIIFLANSSIIGPGALGEIGGGRRFLSLSLKLFQSVFMKSKDGVECVIMLLRLVDVAIIV